MSVLVREGESGGGSGEAGRRRRSASAFLGMGCSGVGDFEGWADAGGEPLLLAGERAEIALYLKPVPEAVGLPEEGTEADGHRGGDDTLAKHDLVDRARGNPDGAGHRILREPHRLEVLFEEDFSWGDRRFHGYDVWRDSNGSMVVYDRHVDATSLRGEPFEPFMSPSLVRVG
jgi:hypothetical protein